MILHRPHHSVDSHGNVHTVAAPEIDGADAVAGFTLLGLLLALVASVFMRRARSTNVPVCSL